MTSSIRKYYPALGGLAGLGLLVVGVLTSSWLSATLGVVLVFACAAWIAVKLRVLGNSATGPSGAVESASPDSSSRRPVLPRQSSGDTGDLVEDMVASNRYALLVRPQIAGNLSPQQLEYAREAMEEDMALVPEGDVFLSQPQPRDEESHPVQPGGRVLRVEAALIDRYPVSNYQFQQFVDAGGYEEMALWDGEIWPGVFGFVDATGCAGPRFWSNGQYPKGKDDHPVVGVCWYEAAAYARWVGKRLPSDAEWVKTGCWPMPSQHGLPTQRRYPWGDAWEPKRANVWTANLGDTCPVTDFEEGGSVAGVYGLVGNVWEWTADPFGLWHGDGSHRGAENFKSLRGGAFDTYFESQANCQFQSGDSPLTRKRNIGFRCALGLCDLQPSSPAADGAADDQLVCEGV